MNQGDTCVTVLVVFSGGVCVGGGTRFTLMLCKILSFSLLTILAYQVLFLRYILSLVYSNLKSTYCKSIVKNVMLRCPVFSEIYLLQVSHIKVE